MKKIAIIFIPLLAIFAGGSLLSDRATSQAQDAIALQEEKASLEREIQQLEIALSQEQALSAINRKARELGMVNQQNTWYIRSPERLSLR